LERTPGKGKRSVSQVGWANYVDGPNKFAANTVCKSGAMAGLAYRMSLVQFERGVLDELDVFTRKQVKRKTRKDGQHHESKFGNTAHGKRRRGRQFVVPSDVQDIAVLGTVYNTLVERAPDIQPSSLVHLIPVMLALTLPAF